MRDDWSIDVSDEAITGGMSTLDLFDNAATRRIVTSGRSVVGRYQQKVNAGRRFFRTANFAGLVSSVCRNVPWD